MLSRRCSPPPLLPACVFRTFPRNAFQKMCTHNAPPLIRLIVSSWLFSPLPPFTGANEWTELWHLCEYTDRHVHPPGPVPEPGEQGAAGEHQTGGSGHPGVTLTEAEITNAKQKQQQQQKKSQKRGEWVVFCCCNLPQFFYFFYCYALNSMGIYIFLNYCYYFNCRCLALKNNYRRFKTNIHVLYIFIWPNIMWCTVYSC